MIRFKCIYCGQRIVARDEGRGKKGKCPKCAHPLVVPHSTKGRPAISIEKTKPMRCREEAVCRRVPGLTKFGDVPEYQRDDQAEIYEENPGWFIPTYDELSLFLTAITLILLCIANSTMREQTYHWLATHNYVWVYILGAIFLCGLGLSIYHVFSAREKTYLEKWGMLIFAVLANAVTGIISGWYVIKHNTVHNWLLVFPVWNIINGVLLLIMLRFRIIDEECISDRDATLTQVVLGLIAVLIIFIPCNYVFKLHWSLTFSICIIYTTSFDRALQSVLPGFTADDTEQ